MLRLELRRLSILVHIQVVFNCQFFCTFKTFGHFCQPCAGPQHSREAERSDPGASSFYFILHHFGILIFCTSMLKQLCGYADAECFVQLDFTTCNCPVSGSVFLLCDRYCYDMTVIWYLSYEVILWIPMVLQLMLK